MRTLLCAALSIAASLLAIGQAQADVIYDFNETSATGFLATLPASAYAPQLVVTDAAYASGSLVFTQSCYLTPPSSCTSSGDMSGVVSLTDATPGFGNRSIDIAFNPDGTLSGSILERGLQEDLTSSGDSFSWAGTLLSDRYPACGSASPCRFTGYWLVDSGPTAVPEPSTLMLVAGAFTGFAAIRFVGRRFAGPASARAAPVPAPWRVRGRARDIAARRRPR